LSRIYQDRHWASDVLIGSAVGYFSGHFLWKLNRKINVIPLGGKSMVGVSVSIPI
jgi:membrane-associated phospholipid phosphatase